MRTLRADELAAIPGLQLLTHVGEVESEETPSGSRYRVRAIVRVPSDSPLARGRSEMSHVIFLEAANNVSHWLELQAPALEGMTFKVPVAFPRGMGLPPVGFDVDLPVIAEAHFQKTDGRWRGEVQVQFFRPDGTRAETVNFPLVERS
jgi:hypothetical protein